MKRILGLLCCTLLLLVVLSGCHNHEWEEATCDSPKMCRSCGEVDGECLGHTWNEATCSLPAVCVNCGKVEGKAKGHTWTEATCTSPKICQECGTTEGSALGHKFTEATCTENSVCLVCGTSGEKAIGHSMLEATCSKPMRCERCNYETGEPKGHVWTEATCTLPSFCTSCGKLGDPALGHNVPGLTCTSDDVCTVCGYTVKAKGHQSTKATCTSPAICSVCSEEIAPALGHTTESGVCGRCGLEFYSTIYGSGDDVISNLTTGDGLYRIHITYSGSRNFIVKKHDSDGKVDLLVNTIGSYDGRVMNESFSDDFALEIESSGSWTVTIERIPSCFDTEFSGHGDEVTDISQVLTSGTYQFTHDGTSNFIVYALTTTGYDLVINTIGVYDGKKLITVPKDSAVLFVVKADGNWSIKKVS